jgi:hypothetical protein
VKAIIVISAWRCSPVRRQRRCRPALEVVEAKLLLQLLVSLLTDPAGLDHRRQFVKRGVGRQIGQVVLLLA